MTLNGGVLIIGSLIWEDHLKEIDRDFIRRDWRNNNLLQNIRLTPAPIRYGRKSNSREKTYTMIFSKGCENNTGQGILLNFNNPVTVFENLERQAIALAIAEGIYKKDNKRITSNWGSVGLLLNPELQKKDPASYEIITKKWSELYMSYCETFVCSEYKCNDDIEGPITQTGFLTINWRQQMNDFDLLLATPVVPDPKRILTPKEISDKINQTSYTKYFKSNIENKIVTFQDKNIEEKLTK